MTRRRSLRVLRAEPSQLKRDAKKSHEWMLKAAKQVSLACSCVLAKFDIGNQGKASAQVKLHVLKASM